MRGKHYFNTSKLFAKLKIAKADGTYLRELAQIQRQDVIILDDFGMQALDNHNRITLLEIIEDRHNRFYHCHLANTSSGMV
ncbi:ATP-binding protein [Flavobacterium sp. FBOR7N2.3]|uniref:ATP-binding protein n=1 Tax=Flavobacterium magnesitis TaxID=3138077 RepID=UPI00358EDC8A